MRCGCGGRTRFIFLRSEEHTSELQSLTNLVCRLLLEKKKKKHANNPTHRAESLLATDGDRPGGVGRTNRVRHHEQADEIHADEPGTRPTPVRKGRHTR